MSASFVCMMPVFVFTLAGCIQGGEIPMGSGVCDVPMFIGQAAQSNPLAPKPIPSHPYLAEQGKNGMHSDSYCTGTYPWSGLLGSNPQVIVDWGQPGGDADINGDGTIDVQDLIEVGTNWGPCT